MVTQLRSAPFHRLRLPRTSMRFSITVIRMAALVPGLLAHTVSAQTAVGTDAGVSVSTMLQTLLGLAVVIAVLFVAAYALRKLNGRPGLGGGGPLRIVGGLMIGPRERIVLVEIDDTWIVVGLVPGQIRTLHTLPKGELNSGGGGEKHFAQWLKQITERKNEGS